jgi:biopolymer transport protein ExbD
MPVKLGSKLPPTEARIEIIPLIDIMFFLLAAFMLVSLSMMHLKTVKVNLPASSTAAAENSEKNLNITVNRAGLAFLDGSAIGEHELTQILPARLKTTPDLRVTISGDQDARHGDVMRILEVVRAAGVSNAAFATRTPAQP